jgi:SGNH domain (fused to AT3 domains)
MAAMARSEGDVKTWLVAAAVLGLGAVTADAGTIVETGPVPAVVATVQAAERGAPVPTPLTPSLTRLRGDLYSFPAGCEPAQYRLCRLGDTSARRTLVVLGDSHAQMWMPALIELAARDHWSLVGLAKVGCVARLWAGLDECGRWFRWARAQTIALHPQATLVIASRAGLADPRAAVKPIDRLSRLLGRHRQRVILLGDAPSQQRDPLECLPAPGATLAECTTTGRPVQARVEAQIAANARRAEVGYIEARPWFCAHPGGSSRAWLCPMVVGRTITYVDRGHVTQTYVRKLTPLLRRAFARALARLPRLRDPE